MDSLLFRTRPALWVALLAACLSAFMVMVAPAPALASQGTVWAEVGDAGHLPNTANRVTDPADGDLLTITGALTETADADLYRICIKPRDVNNFSATTVGGAYFDTQLFLFKPAFTNPRRETLKASGVEANDDSAETLQSTLPASSAPPAPQAPGPFYLGISSYDNDPLDRFGNLIFPSDPFNGVFGPISNGPLAAWTNNGGSGGDYSISLTGASWCPEDIVR